MHHRITTALLVAFAIWATLSLTPGQTLAQEAKAPAAKAQPKQQSHPLVGTWKLVSAKYGGNDHAFPAGSTMLKHVTPSQFMWASYDKDGKITRAAGGAYKIDGDKYAETPEYGFGEDFESIKGQSHAFTWKVEGSKWHHNGTLAGGLTIDEVWERVEGK